MCSASWISLAAASSSTRRACQHTHACSMACICHRRPTLLPRYLSRLRCEHAWLQTTQKCDKVLCNQRRDAAVPIRVNLLLLTLSTCLRHAYMAAATQIVSHRFIILLSVFVLFCRRPHICHALLSRVLCRLVERWTSSKLSFSAAMRPFAI